MSIILLGFSSNISSSFRGIMITLMIMILWLSNWEPLQKTTRDWPTIPWGYQPSTNNQFSNYKPLRKHVIISTRSLDSYFCRKNHWFHLFLTISHRIHGAGIYANKKGFFVDGIHGTPYIAAPWIASGLIFDWGSNSLFHCHGSHPVSARINNVNDS